MRDRQHRTPFWPPEEWVVAVLLALGIATWIACAAWGAEPDVRPTLWIYSRAKGCPPCAALKREFKDQKALRTFDLIWLDGTGYEVPYIYYRDANGRWVKRGGWTYGDYPAFLAQWTKDTKRKTT